MNDKIIIAVIALLVGFGIGYISHTQPPVGGTIYNRTITFTDGIKVDDGELKLGGTAITATAAELNTLDGVLKGSVTYDPSSLATSTGETKALTVTGAAVGDYCIVSAPYDLQDMSATCYVQAANTVEIRLFNTGDATTDLASGTWRVLVIPK